MAYKLTKLITNTVLALNYNRSNEKPE